MSDPQVFIYETYKGRLENGTEVLVQIFRDPDSREVVTCQLAFKPYSEYSWGRPVHLEATK